MLKKKAKKGFTIVELVIVIAVIAILAAVLIPTFTNVVNKANESAALSEAKNAYTEFLANELTNGTYETDDVVIVSGEYKFTVKDGELSESSSATTDGYIQVLDSSKQNPYGEVEIWSKYTTNSVYANVASTFNQAMQTENYSHENNREYFVVVGEDVYTVSYIATTTNSSNSNSTKITCTAVSVSSVTKSDITGTSSSYSQVGSTSVYYKTTTQG